MREARVTVDDEELDTMGISGLVDVCREAGVRDFEELVCRGTGATVQVGVEQRLDEERLSSLSCVDDWEYVSADADEHRYVVTFTAPELPDNLEDSADDLLGTCDPDVDGDDTTMSLVGPQDAISETIDGYETAGVSANLERIGAYAGSRQPLEALTDRQREVIQTAFDMGYYEVPREVSTSDVAAELDLDPSTVTEHLQRAERNVLSEHL
jgi:DNA-binding CsgD family transcriptional regulator